MAKFYDIKDPWTCPIEELQAAKEACANKMEYFGSLEQGCKKFINSVYGALGSNFYVCANTAIAESVTLQGQDLIKYSVKCVNKFFNEYWNNLEKIFTPSVYLMNSSMDTILFSSVCTHTRELYVRIVPNDLVYDDAIMLMPKDVFGTGIGVIEKRLRKSYSANVCEKDVNGRTCVIVSNPNYDMLCYVNANLSPYERIVNDIKRQNPSCDIDPEEFANNCKNNKIVFNFGTGETCQVYGDSCSGDTEIDFCTSETVACMSVSELFDSYSDTMVTLRGKDFVTPTDKLRVKNIDGDGHLTYASVSHIIRHKVGKAMWRVGSFYRHSHVDVTEDHSVIVSCGGTLMHKCPKDIDIVNDRLLVAKSDYSGYALSKIETCEKLSGNGEMYVYDIEVKTNNEAEHCFFGNNILIHNTDSVSKDSIIRSKKHPDGITIEELYNENIQNVGDTTIAGHESVNTDDMVLNMRGVFPYSTYFAKVARIIRHKVSKEKWKLTTVDGGYSVECTNNHSLIVIGKENRFRKVLPEDVKLGDFVLTCSQSGVSDSELCQCTRMIQTCEKIGVYEDEYVYDIEIDDDTHTFVANDILVHNSAYITLQPLIEGCKIIPREMETHFILSFNENILADYLDGRFIDYAKAYNCKENLEAFELEKIARSLLMQKKKKYVMDISWKEPDVFLEPLHNLVFKGVEVAKGETSLFVRGEQKEFVRWVMDNINQGKPLRYPDIVARLRKIKERFMLASIDDVCKITSMSDYEKYVFNDKGSEVVYCDGVVVPYHAKAAAWYNNMLQTSASEYKSKYPLIKRGEKVKVYNVLSPSDPTHDRFAYIPGNFPSEFAPQIDIDAQFNDLILDPINRYVEALGYQPIGPRLTYKARLY